MTTAGDNSTGGAAAASSADVDRREGDPYARSSAATCPPLVRLQCYGMCCPFLETEEERDARAGYSELQDRPIAWYRKKRAGPPAAALDGIGGGDVRRVASSGRDLLAELGLMFGVGGGGGGGREDGYYCHPVARTLDDVRRRPRHDERRGHRRPRPGDTDTGAGRRIVVE